jgi:YegS/Rv2252/BmrU family lipid kinase
MMEATAREQLSHVFVVLNPMAGNSTAADVRAALDRYFSADRWSQEIYETTGDEEVADIVRAALVRGCDLVIAAGGDGTVSDAAEALVHSDVPLGIIPVGTANVLARELGLPLDLEGACALLAGEHTTNSIDAMQVGDKAFFLHIGVGIDSLMIRDTDRAAKRRFGRLAYLWIALRWLIGYQPRRFTIVVDGRRLRPRAAQVLIANGGLLGVPPFRWGPDIRPDDGRIDVCVLSARSLGDYLRVAWQVLIGHRRRSPNIRYYSAERSIVVDADHPLPIQGDGEILGETPARVQVIPDAVAIVVSPVSVPRQQPAAEGQLVGA